MTFAIRKMMESDIGLMADAFAAMNKTRTQYEEYWGENKAGSRVTLVATVDSCIVGYTNILWRSQYAPFQQDNIPEINDLNVVAEHRDQGIGRSLIQECERIVTEAGHVVIGIGVGLTPDYAAAQHLYPRLDYIADGRGIHTSRWRDEVYFTKSLL